MGNPEFGDDHMQEILKKTQDAIDKNGWMHSGDKGCENKDGFVRITGR
jgi:long-subunit acyl-CoA synthetase (AMP-forming)